jgi:RNA polymerase sigma factor (TIGR02999 family)
LKGPLIFDIAGPLSTCYYRFHVRCLLGQKKYAKAEPFLLLLHRRQTAGKLEVMADLTQILNAIDRGDPHCAEQLLPLVYDELRKLAAEKMAQEQPGQTLQATALVHEAYVRLVDVDQVQHWNSRGHFFAAAAEAMRRILIEQARHKASARAGGNFQRVDLSAIEPPSRQAQVDLLALNDALAQLEQTDARAAAVVKLRYFAGLTTLEAASTLGVSLATAENDWAYAKSYLRLQLSEADSRLEIPTPER